MYFIKAYLTLIIFTSVTTLGDYFKDYKLIRFFSENEDQLKLLSSLIHNEDFDVWDHEETHLDVVLSPNAFDAYSKFFNEYNIKFRILNENIQKTIDEEARSIIIQRLLNRKNSRVVNNYVSHGEINSWLDEQASSNPTWISTENIGTTHENRQMKVIVLKKPTTKRLVWIDCGIHAREWISPSTCVWMIDALIRDYGNVAEVTSILDYYEIHVLPVVNPDGYEYSRLSGSTRLWRKNRRVVEGWSPCMGVDLNRNFGHYWMVAGASSSPCADTYAGPSADSEPETLAVEGAIKAKSGQWDSFITIHSYGQYWMTPWGYTTSLPSDYSDLASKSQIGANAIRSVFGSVFRVGSVTNLLYAAAGGSFDWTKGVENIKYSVGLELRPSSSDIDSSFGFVLPADRIPKAGEETYKGIVAFLNSIKP